MGIIVSILFILLGILAATAGLLLLGLLVLCISARCVDLNRQYEKESRWYRALLLIATAVTCIALRVRFHVSGKECVPKDGSFLLVCNHRSKFDPILTWFLFPKKKIVYLTKPENMQIPAFGRIVHRLRFIQIDRTSIGASAAAFRRGTELLQEPDTIVAVYPEGTRSLDCSLLPFHAVVFTMAKHAKVPVVVMSIRGTEKIKQNMPWHTSPVRFYFIETIPAEWIAQNKTRDLCARAERGIRASLEKNND